MFILFGNYSVLIKADGVSFILQKQKTKTKRDLCKDLFPIIIKSILSILLPLYENKVKTVMENNSTNMNTTNIYQNLSRQLIEH
jgi:hypothetical protein